MINQNSHVMTQVNNVLKHWINFLKQELISLTIIWMFSRSLSSATHAEIYVLNVIMFCPTRNVITWRGQNNIIIPGEWIFLITQIA